MLTTPFTKLCAIEHPIVLAPLAGGPGTPELAAAVCEAGALGSLGCGRSRRSRRRRSWAELRQAAARAGDAGLLSLWAAQAVGLARSLPARELVRALVDETGAAIERLSGAASAGGDR